MKYFLSLLLAVTICLAFSRAALAATLASDGSLSDVQSKVNSAVDGDTVTIPGGGFTWTGTLTISGKGIKIQGGGSGRVIGRSTSSVTVGTGSKTFTTQSGLSLTPGLGIVIQRLGGNIVNGQPTGDLPYMQGTVTSYSGTTLVLDSTSVSGSGTHPLWIISTHPTTYIIDNADPSPMISVTEDASHNVEFTGILWIVGTVPADSSMFSLEYVSGGRPILIHDCMMRMGNNCSGIRPRTPRGIVWNCSFVAFNWTENSQPVNLPDSGHDAWVSLSTMGTNDTTGTNNFYIENCDFHAILNTVNADDNAKIVVRNNLFNNSGCGTHGADSSNVGARHYEFYDNEFLFNAYSDGKTLNLGYFFYLRGGTGLITDNIIPDINSGDFGNKPEINATVQNLQRNSGPNPCWGSGIAGIQYPCPRQVGMGRVTGAAGNDSITYKGDSEPLYIWNNTGTVLFSISDFGGTECTNVGGVYTVPDSSASYIVEGRDYTNGIAKPGWTKYTYPHPLRTSSSSSTTNVTSAVFLNGRQTLGGRITISR